MDELRRLGLKPEGEDNEVRCGVAVIVLRSFATPMLNNCALLHESLHSYSKGGRHILLLNLHVISVQASGF